MSVVIPAYNVERFVKESIRSVLRQTYSHLEVIVSDDGSDDRTREVAEAIDDPRLHVITSENGGVGAARNRGLRLAHGELVAFLDADDFWLPEKLARHVALSVTRPDVAASGSLMRYVSSSGRQLGTSGELVDERDHERIARGEFMPFPLSSIVFRGSAVEAVGGFDESLALYVPGLVEDLDLLARVARIGTVTCIPEVLGYYRIHGGSASVRRFHSQRLGTRFVHARLAAEREGRTLSWNTFVQSFRPTLRNRYGDQIRMWYRSAGLSVAERRWLRAAGYATLALVFGPRYSIRRARRQLLATTDSRLARTGGAR